jgi:hypothetical protein
VVAVAAPTVARARTDGRALRWVGLAPEVATVGLAAGLRLVALARVPSDPYYDAAVRSMGASWSAFLAGAFEPGRRVAIDKPPVDLWLQVGATKLFGFTALALHVPEALGGVALVVLVMALLRALLGRGAALAGGLALAVLPSAVVTARSDTMDSVMAALAVAGALLVVRAARTQRLAPLAGAGVLVGLAFDVKLAEALLPAAAVALLWWLIAPRVPGQRRRGALIGVAAFLVTATAWLVVVSLVPLHPRPWALGSTSGSPWQAALVYNGIDRVVPGRATHSGAAVATTTTGSRARARRRALPPSWPGVAHAAALGPSAPRSLDRDRGGRRARGAGGGAGARAAVAVGPHRPWRAARPRRVARRRDRPLQRDARPAPALPRVPRPGGRGGARRRVGGDAARARARCQGNGHHNIWRRARRAARDLRRRRRPCDAGLRPPRRAAGRPVRRPGRLPPCPRRRRQR